MSVSIIIPVRNGARHIVEAIESVLQQGEIVGEILVIDDHSTDDTRARVQAISDGRIRLLEHSAESRGVSAVRNFGLLQAKSDWIMFLDADDRLRAGALGDLHSRTHLAEAVAVYGDYERISETGRQIGHRALIRIRRKPEGQILERLLRGNFIVNGGVMLVRKAAFASVGGFNETLSYAEDWHGWCRLAAIGNFVYLPGCCVLDYRVHSASVMMKRLLSIKDCLPAIDAIFTDPVVRAVITPQRLLELRKKAESHMNAYVAAQAFRARRYSDAFLCLGKTLLQRPEQTPRVILLSAAAVAGM